MNKTIFSCYNDFIARAVIGSCGRASRIDLSVRTAEILGPVVKLELKTEHM